MKAIFLPYVSIADMLTQTFGPDCEVVLHDLSDPEHSVVYVSNGAVTGRRPGDSFDQLVRQVILSDERQGDYAANYYFTAPNGKRIRSSTVLLRDADGRLEGAMCINLDTTRLTQQIAYLQSFLPDRPEPKQPPQSEHISVMIENLMDNILSGCDVQSLSREERIAKVQSKTKDPAIVVMDEKGVFLMKGSIEKAAEKLGVNKVTIYSYLDEARGKRG